MHLAYIVTAYKLPDLLIRLVRRLQSPNATFVIHVDKKSPLEVQSRMQSGLQDAPGVYFIEPHKCYWGDFGHVRATLKGMRELLARAVPFDYAILLTGQDYPIKPNGVIERVLARARGNSFMSYVPLPSDDWEVMDRLERWHYWFHGKHVGFPLNPKPGAIRKKIELLINSRLPARRELPFGLRPFGGSSYWCLTKEAVQYVAEYLAGHRELIGFFKHTLIPDELFFQTLLMNSPLREKVINDDLRYVDWGTGSRHPAVLDRNDFGRLRSAQKLFARKFDPGVDSAILNMIDRHLLHVGADHAAAMS